MRHFHDYNILNTFIRVPFPSQLVMVNVKCICADKLHFRFVAVHIFILWQKDSLNKKALCG